MKNLDKKEVTLSEFEWKNFKKTLVLILAFLIALAVLTAITVLTSPAHAQTIKKDSVKAKPYQVDLNKPVTFTISFTVPAGLVDNWLFVEQYPGGAQALSNSDRLSAKQVNAYLLTHQMVADSLAMNLYRQYSKYLKDDRQRFVADSLKHRK